MPDEQEKAIDDLRFFYQRRIHNKRNGRECKNCIGNARRKR